MALAGDNGTADSKRSSKRLSKDQAPPEIPAGEVVAPPGVVEMTDENPTVLTLTPTEWATYSSALGTSPHMVLGALMVNRPYRLDEATALVAAFLSSPAEKE